MTSHPAVRLHSVGLRSFRSYRHLELPLHAGLNVFLGANGAGKTNLLEAVAYLALGRSPRNARDADLATDGSAGFEIHASVSDSPPASSGRPSCIAVRYRPGLGRTVQLDGQVPGPPSSLYGRVLAVFFCPDDLWLLKGPPAGRRQFLDRLLVQASPLYADALNRYRHALAQRNATLQQVRARRAGRALLAIWEPQLVQYGAEMLQRRAAAVQGLEAAAAAAYQEVAGADEPLACRYVPGLGAALDPGEPRAWAVRFQEALERQAEADVAVAATTVGPHRDDLHVLISGRSVLRFASQGQQRSAALALKFAERALLRRLTGRLPLLLVDDVCSELDARRREALRRLLTEEGQVFLTTADEAQAAELPDDGRYAVVPGSITALRPIRP